MSEAEITLTAQQVKDILSAMQDHGVWTGTPMEGTEEENAKAFVSNALRAARTGATHNQIVQAVLDIVGEQAPGQDAPAALAAPAAPEVSYLNEYQIGLLWSTAETFSIERPDALWIAQQAIGSAVTFERFESDWFVTALNAISTEGAHRASGGEPTRKPFPKPEPDTAAYTESEAAEQVEIAEEGMQAANEALATEESQAPVETARFDHLDLALDPDNDSFVRLAELAALAEVGMDEVKEYVRTNYGRSVPELNRTQFNAIYEMLCSAAKLDYPGDEPRGYDPTDPEQPPFEPGEPKAEADDPTENRGRRRRASDGTLHFKDELEAYEASLLAENEGEGANRVPEADGQVPEPAPSPSPVDGTCEDSRSGQPAEPYVAPIDRRAGSIMEEHLSNRNLAAAKIAKENLPIPAEVPGDAEPIPADISILPDAEIRRLHSLFHSYHSRATYLLACEESDENAAHAIHQDHFNRAFRQEIGGDAKDAKVTVAKAQASLDTTVITWRQKRDEHAAAVKQLKQLAGYYENTCTRLSREASMRQAERDSVPS